MGKSRLKPGDVVVWYEPFDNDEWNWGVSTVNDITESTDHYPIIIDWPNVLPENSPELIEGKDWSFADGSLGNCFPYEFIFKVGEL